jgi:endonuclease/exonuclease/phosphatase (EEP) superfamily protein YafD
VRWWALAGAGLVTVLVHLWLLWPYAIAPAGPSPAPGARSVRVASFNVHTDNRRFDEVLAALRALDADVVALLEVDGRWTQQLRALEATYPHSIRRIRLDNFGICLLSKWPLRRAEAWYQGEIPALDATLDIAGRDLRLLALHPPPPLAEASRRERDAILARAAALVGKHADPAAVVVGDFNTTPFTAAFRDLCTRGSLRDAAWGHGYGATWMDHLGLLAMKLDYICVGPAIAVADFTVHGRFGSDHNLISADLLLPGDPSE